MKYSIKYKILFGVGTIVVVVMLLSGAFLYSYMSKVLKEQIIHDDNVKLMQASSQLNHTIDDIIRVSQFAVTDENIINYLRDSKKDNMDYIDKYSIKYKCSQQLARMTFIRDYIVSAAIYIDKDNVIAFSPMWNTYFAEELEKDWFQSFLAKGKERGFTEKHTLYMRFSQSYNSENRTETVSYICPIFDQTNPSKRLGTLVLNIDYAYLVNPITSIQNEFDHIRLEDTEGNLLFGDDKALYAIDNKTSFIMDVESIDWSIIAFLKDQRISKKMWGTLVVMFLAMAVSLILILALLTYVICNIAKPITELTESIKKVAQGDLTMKINIRTGDELEVLADCFNHMTNSLQQYMNKLLMGEKVKRSMQINLLLTQINPHFIYNTLNSVIYLAQMQRCDDVVIITRSFIGILKDLVHIGNSSMFTTLEEELNVTRYYLEIQRYRYPDRFELIEDIDQKVLGCKVPRTVLQPLVENALYHGICPRLQKGHIHLCIKHEEGNVFIYLSDDGVGMTDEKLKSLKADFKSSHNGNKMKSIGIMNIVERLSIMYGPASCFDIASSTDSGTKISIKIPYNEKEPQSELNKSISDDVIAYID